jgi:DNA-binding LacI/PurR family transcriptional regulator/DNA-binding FadR family transcriptional regulator
VEAFAVQKASDFITQNLKSQVWSDGDRLPSLDELSRMAGVSKGSMWKAIDLIKKQGLVTTRYGSGIFAGAEETNRAIERPPIKIHTWESKRRLFEQDLFKGIFIPGKPLPTVGELQARYGVSFRTMRKILKALADDHILNAIRKKFIVPAMQNKPYLNSVCMLWEGGNYAVKSRPYREGRIIESFQKECTVFDCSLAFLGFELDARPAVETLKPLLRKNEKAIGYIIRPITHEDSASMVKYIDLLLRLSLENKPIAILDELGIFSLPQPLASNRLIKVFRIADISAGAAVGRTLLRLGHKRVAYFSHFQSHVWSSRRSQGLVAEFEKVGFGGSVSIYTMEDPADLVTTLLLPQGLTTQEQDSVFPGLRTNALDGPAIKARFGFLDPVIKECRDAIQNLNTNVRELATTSRKKMHGKVYDFMMDHGMDFIQSDMMEILYRSLFEKAIADQSYSAWIAANDEIAVYALRFLKNRKKRVPEDVSVVGFDGDPIGFENGITSFDFDFYNIARQMLSFIAHPLRTTTFTKKSIVEMPGCLLHRASTDTSAA